MRPEILFAIKKYASLALAVAAPIWLLAWLLAANGAGAELLQPVIRFGGIPVQAAAITLLGCMAVESLNLTGKEKQSSAAAVWIVFAGIFAALALLTLFAPTL